MWINCEWISDEKMIFYDNHQSWANEERVISYSCKRQIRCRSKSLFILGGHNYDTEEQWKHLQSTEGRGAHSVRKKCYVDSDKKTSSSNMASVASSSEANAAASETEEVNPETEEKQGEELVYTVENI